MNHNLASPDRGWFAFRFMKYERIYLHAFETGSKAQAGICKWLACYNAERRLLTQGILTPGELHASKTEPFTIAA